MRSSNSATGEFIERAEKSPRTSNGLKGASTSQRISSILFGDRYPGATIGLPTGENLGAWVLDLDRHTDKDGKLVADGHVWLAEMEAKHGPLPETARARTAGNGTHIFFKHVEGLRNRAAFAAGADTRAEGGYILSPGSVMADGRRYEWIDANGTPYDPVTLPEFAPAPAWLLELLQPVAREQETATYTPVTSSHERYVARAIESEIEKLVATRAGRNAALNTAALSLGTLVGAGVLSRSEAESHLMQAAHANGYVAKDGERAARQTMKSGLDSGIKSPRQIAERPVTSANDNTPAQDVSRLIENARKKAAGEMAGDGKGTVQVAAAANATTPAPPPTTPRVKARFEKTWFDEIEEGVAKEMFIKGAFGVREFTTISGLPGTGKSVITTDAACHVACGMEWHGRKVKQGLVVYVAAERKPLTERRMMAFRKHYDVKNVPLLVIGGRLDFTKDLVDARALIGAIKEAETETGMDCVWVIIDTLTRVFGAGDQNASKDMTRFVQSCDEILAETTAHVTAIHHSAWSGERGKGAIDLDGAVDASFMVKKDHGKYKLICDGTNDGDEGDIVAFKMDSVTLGHDADGEPTTAPVVVSVEAQAAGPVSGGPNGINAKVLAALVAAIGQVGVEPQGQQYPEDIMVVKEGDWRAAYLATGEGKDDTMRKRFDRGQKALLESGAVNTLGQWFWPA